VYYEKSTGFAFEIIPYCFQPIDPIDSRMRNDKVVAGKSITFEKLREMNVTIRFDGQRRLILLNGMKIMIIHHRGYFTIVFRHGLVIIVKFTF
jgi:hypothetical protein